eukprot:1839850-Prymnesium_polylepis.1
MRGSRVLRGRGARTHLKDLDALKEKGLRRYEVDLGAILGDGRAQVGVVGVGHLLPWEEVGEDRVE